MKKIKTPISELFETIIESPEKYTFEFIAEEEFKTEIVIPLEIIDEREHKRIRYRKNTNNSTKKQNRRN